MVNTARCQQGGLSEKHAIFVKFLPLETRMNRLFLHSQFSLTIWELCRVWTGEKVTAHQTKKNKCGETDELTAVSQVN